MADIFVSYAREDRAIVEALAAQLQTCGWSVWWDRRILAGKEFDEVIEAEIQAARCVLVVWTGQSVKSRWVKVEAGEGHSRGILVPIVIGDCSPPLAFRNVQAVALQLPVASHAQEFTDLVDAIAELTGSRPGGATRAAAPPPPPPPPPPPLDRPTAAPVAPPPEARHYRAYVLPGAIVAGLTLATTVGYVLMRDSDPASPASATAPSAPPPVATTGPAQSNPDTPANAGAVPSTTGAVPAGRPPSNDVSAPASPGDLSPDAIRAFVNQYLSVVNRSDVDGLLRFYAGDVVYFGKGAVGRDFIRQDKLSYYKRWPVVSQTLQGDLSIADGGVADTKVVKYASLYTVRSPGRNAHASGTIATTLVLRRRQDGIEIINQQEVSKTDRQ